MMVIIHNSFSKIFLKISYRTAGNCIRYFIRTELSQKKKHHRKNKDENECDVRE